MLRSNSLVLGFDALGKMFQQFTRRYISLFWLTCLFAVLLSALVSVYFGVLMESFQFVVFPIVLVIVWRLPKESQSRLPTPLLLLAFLLWVSVRSYGYVTDRLNGHAVLLAHFKKDSGGVEAQHFYRRYTEISRTYELLPMHLLHRGFDNDREAREYLAQTESSPFLMYGPTSWFRLVFTESVSGYTDEYPLLARPSEIPEYFSNAAKEFGIALNRDVVVVELNSLDVPFAVAYQPEVIGVPGEPAELTRHSVAWLSKGLELFDPTPGESIGEERLVGRRAKRFNAFYEASHVAGSWRTQVLLGLSHYFLGTMDLLDALDREGTELMPIESALSSFKKAAGLAIQGSDPEVFSAIFNNAAVAQIAKGGSPENVKKARSWLKLALTTQFHTGEPVLGARAAMLNLISLDQAAPELF